MQVDGGGCGSDIQIHWSPTCRAASFLPASRGGGWGNRGVSLKLQPRCGSASQLVFSCRSQDKEDSELLQQDPQGKFLLDSRLPWMVRYIPSTSGGGSSGLRILRQVSHRPLDNSAPGSNVLVVSSYDAGSGELMMRAKQRCTFSRAPIKVGIAVVDLATVYLEWLSSCSVMLLYCSEQMLPYWGHVVEDT